MATKLDFLLSPTIKLKLSGFRAFVLDAVYNRVFSLYSEVLGTLQCVYTMWSLSIFVEIFLSLNYLLSPL